MSYDEAKRRCLALVPDPGKRFWVQPQTGDSYLIEVLALSHFITVTRKRMETSLVVCMGDDRSHQWSIPVREWMAMLEMKVVRELR